MAKDQAHSEPATGNLPSWLPAANRVVVWLQRRGLKTGTIHILTVPGRVSGEPRTTPVSVLTVGGVRHIIGGLDDADWVQNVRATGWGHLAYGRNEEKVSLTELGVEERGPILRAFPTEIPHGTQFFERAHGIKPTPDEFASLADQCPVFRVEAFTER